MPKTAKQNPLDESTLHLLHRATLLGSALFEDNVLLTQRQYAILRAVADNEGATQAQLVQLTLIDRSTLAEVITRMVKKGLLARHRSENDARASDVQLSELGRMILAEAEELAGRVDKRILDSLLPKRREAFLKNLKAIISGMSSLENIRQAAAPPKS